MTSHAFRFGTVGGFARDGEAWTALARRAEDLGYATLLIPDTLTTLSPFTAAAAAAAVTSRLRVGTYVAAAPYRTPAAVAREVGTLRTLTGGRFELGIGAGRPGAEQEAAALGVRFGTPSERVRRVVDTLDAVDEDVPVLIAAAGTRLLRLAAERADTVALGLPATATEDDLAAKLDELYELAGDRFNELEINTNLAAVGDELPAWLSQQLGTDPREIVAKGGYGILTGTLDQMADTLRRRRDRLGVSYISVSAQFLEQFAPLVERLAGT
ncbi:LLM class flavin-dependent oxidoreductase [Nonomuraea typhae]|uniref:LLM class flavin-dependent oxidoreductase n=1 Tax=Nonomuraea typhae TaxID=2603600 RepID=UPI0012FBF7E7|nr:LLM class flavin-dependent oxidoreductase [Nonomuraea typhae]